MRAVAGLLSIIAAFGGAYAGYALQRAVGPEAPTATAFEGPGGQEVEEPVEEVPGGGSLFEARHARKVVASLRRELGSEGRVDYFDLRENSASATSTKRDGSRLSLQFDAVGSVRVIEIDGTDSTSSSIGVTRIEPKAIERAARAARKESDGKLESMTLTPSTREWYIRMADGEPDTLVANLDGSGVRIPGEPDPTPRGATDESLLRTQNFRRVLQAIARDADGRASRLARLDVRPLRVGVEVRQGTRSLRLDYDVDIQRTGRDISAASPGDTLALSAIRPNVIERMASAASKRSKRHNLGNVDYVLLQPAGFIDGKPGWSIYFKGGGYYFANIRGGGLKRPGE